ncbi:outer membrane protein assembly factor BamE [Rickettsiales bacterium]|nr:outer membrane protein assembly factor BamE [Rickettsiales bacterium]
MTEYKNKFFFYKLIKQGVILLFVAALSASCVKNYSSTGYSFNQSTIDTLKVNKTRKAVVERRLGSPSTVSTYGDDIWYYISTEYENVAFFDPKIKKQTVLEIEFNSNETIKSIKKYDAKDAKAVNFSKDKTYVGGDDFTVLQQLIGNIGRFNSPSAPQRNP